MERWRDGSRFYTRQGLVRLDGRVGFALRKNHAEVKSKTSRKKEMLGDW